MTDAVHLDFETRSVVDLKKFGFDRYCANESTAPTCMAYSFNDEPEVPLIPSYLEGATRRLPVWNPALRRLLDHVASGGLVYAHNAQFEFGIWNRRCVPLYGWPELKIEQVRCTMAMALAMSLPGALGEVAIALGVPERKDYDGHRAMMRTCKPRSYGKPSKTDPGCPTCNGTAIVSNDACPVCVTWWDDAETYGTLYRYCQQDVRTERDIHRRMVDLSPQEWRVWQLDQKINRYGVRIDVPAVSSAVQVVVSEKKRMDADMKRITGGHVDTCQSSAKLTEWLCAQGAVTAGVAKADVKALLDEDDLPGDLWDDGLLIESREDGPVRAALKVRQVAAKASTAKLQKMLDTIGPDQIARFLYQYHAAHTGRWGGRRIQPQNMMRPFKFFEDVEKQEAVITALVSGASAQSMSLFFGEPMDAVASVMRGFLIPHVGNEFLVGDFANIEGRGLAWLAGDERKLEAFRMQDAGTGPEIYIVAGASIYKVDPRTLTKKSPERQIGKVAELACIAEGQLVLTDAGLVPIEKVTGEMLVWDGVDFVSHSGLVFRGEREVISYDGLVATPDHEVWVLGSSEPVPFGIAAARGAHLAVSGIGRSPVRLGEDCECREAMGRGLAATDGARAMHRLQPGDLDQLQFANAGRVERLPIVLAASQNPEEVGSSADRSEGALHESERSGVQELWRAGNHLRLSERSGSGAVDSCESRTSAGQVRAGQDGQQQGLRAGELALGSAFGESGESQELADAGLEPGRLAVLTQSRGADAGRRNDAGTSDRVREESRIGEAQELARNCGKARTYDLLNCGPRNRFTVSGKLVHNCGFQGGIGAFKAMARVYGMHNIPDRQADEIVQAWRDAHPAVAGTQTEYGRKGGYWADVEKAAMDAVRYPGKKFDAGAPGREVTYLVNGSFLWARLPSGRCLCYPYPDVRSVMTSWGKPKDALTYKTALSGDPKSRKKMVEDLGNTNKFARISTYGGSLTENNDQAICADIQRDAMLRLADAGLPIAMHTHDEIVGEVAKGRGKELLPKFKHLMEVVPEWAAGLPITVDAFTAHRYRK